MELGNHLIEKIPQNVKLLNFTHTHLININYLLS